MADVGRPTVITDEAIRKLEEAWVMDCTDLEACLYADISKTALYDYQQEHPEFAERKEALKESPFLLARKTIYQNLTDIDTAQWYMERKKKDEFSQRNELTGKDGKEIPVTPAVINIIRPDGIELQAIPETIPGVAVSDGQSND